MHEDLARPLPGSRRSCRAAPRANAVLIHHQVRHNHSQPLLWYWQYRPPLSVLTMCSTRSYLSVITLSRFQFCISLWLFCLFEGIHMHTAKCPKTANTALFYILSISSNSVKYLSNFWQMIVSLFTKYSAPISLSILSRISISSCVS